MSITEDHRAYASYVYSEVTILLLNKAYREKHNFDKLFGCLKIEFKETRKERKEKNIFRGFYLRVVFVKDFTDNFLNNIFQSYNLSKGSINKTHYIPLYFPSK